MPDTWNLVLLILRAWLGVVIFVHGANHLMSTVRGRKRADYFDALGVRPGNVHAWTVTIVELAVAEVLVAGLVTPIAAGVLGALMLVALVTDNRNRGFFVGSSSDGWEFVATIGVAALTLGAIGPGKWSLDNAAGISFPFEAPNALIITALVAVGVAGAFLALFWRPAKKTATSSRTQTHSQTAKAA